MASREFAVGDRIQYRNYPVASARNSIHVGTIVRESALGAGYRVLPDGSKSERYVSKERVIGPAPTPDPVVPEIHVGTEVRVDHEQLGQFFGRVIKVIMSDTNVPNVEVQAENNGSGGAIYSVPSTCCTPKPEPVFAHTIPREWVEGATERQPYNEGYSTEGYDPPTERTLASQDQALATLARQIEQQRQIIERLRTDNKHLQQRIERQKSVHNSLAKRNRELNRDNGRFRREAEAAEKNLRLAATSITRASNNVAAIIEDDDEEF